MTDLATLRNPFRDNVVQDAWQSPGDVASIHANAFAKCLEVIDSARKSVPDSLLITGGAGSGKTHLLTRLQRHLAQTARDAPDRVLSCLFVFVRLQTSPQLLWQHVRKRLATDLMRRNEGVTQLQRLIAHQIGVRRGVSPKAVVRELRVLMKEGPDPKLSDELLDVATDASLPHALGVVLDKLMYDASIRDAQAWLAGESLPASLLEQLGVGAEDDDDRESACRELVTALCRLAPSTLPVVFCFDQVEALQSAAHDRDAFFKFARMAADLHDADPNVCVITCLQSALTDEFIASVRDADRDRIAKRAVTLDPLSKDQVAELVTARLNEIPELAAARTPEEPFYPLATSFVNGLSRESPCVARKVLAACGRRFEEIRQHGKAPPPIPTEAFLARELEERELEATRTTAPADTTRIVLHGIQALTEVGALDARPDEVADVVLSRGPQKIAVSVRNDADGRSLFRKLDRLAQKHPRADGARLVIVRDPRLPISKNAKKSRELLSTLRAQGAALVEPSVAALAALDALSSILSDAKSGDLAHDGASIAEQTVLAWLRETREALPFEPMRELVRAMMESAPADAASEREQDLAEHLGIQRVVLLEEASRVLGHPEQALLEVARARRDHFLVLEGPPIVIVDVAGIAPEVTV
jgi:hypothetical protein